MLFRAGRAAAWTVAVCCAAVGLWRHGAWACETVMVGAALGSRDALAAEATRLYNKKKYTEAAALFLKAHRADPQADAVRLSLARSYMAAGQIAQACYVYHVYLKNAPESPERSKAQQEYEQCGRRLAAKGQRPVAETVAEFVELRALFYNAWAEGRFFGSGSAYDLLQQILDKGFVGGELTDMAVKLGQAARGDLDRMMEEALYHATMTPAEVDAGYCLARVVVGLDAAAGKCAGCALFFQGLRSLQQGDFGAAEALFAQAGGAEPRQLEYAMFRARAAWLGGHPNQALRLMQTLAPRDPRTQVVKTAAALQRSAAEGAAELARGLFAQHFVAP